MYGFKSFARKTEILLEKSMNVIIGPNGSGKSNITDALCFVLGRLSMKDIRVTKAANLLFTGNQTYKGANEATVELVLDNQKREVSIDKDEVSIKRILRKDGQSIYRIGNETKTRSEVLELLAQAGIDPYGFNIVLQGQINTMIQMSSEDRRKIIEDVAGISVYEERKRKSLLELDKAEEKLKEVKAALRERMGFLKTLEKERQDALNYQRLELMVKRSKKTLINAAIMEKEKGIWSIDKIVDNLNKEIQELKKKIQEKNINIEELQTKLSILNKTIQESSGEEQGKLNNEVSDLKALIAGYKVKMENYEKRINEYSNKINNLDGKKERLEKEINEIQTNSPDIKKKREEQKKLQEMQDKLERQRRRFYSLKSQLGTLDNKINEKEKYLIESKKEIDLVQNNIETIQKNIKYSNDIVSSENLKVACKNKLYELKLEIEKTSDDILKIEKENAVFDNLIKQEEKLRDSILNLDKCPTCKQDVKEDYKKSIQDDSQIKIDEYSLSRQNNISKCEELKDKKINLSTEQSKISTKINEIEIDVVNLRNIDEKNNHIKNIISQRQESKNMLDSFNKEYSELNKEFQSLKDVEQDYDNVRVRLQEINFSDIDVDSEVSIKQREMSTIDNERRSYVLEIDDFSEQLKKNSVLVEENQKMLNKKEDELQKLYDKCEKLFEQKNEMDDKKKVYETEIMGFNNSVKNYEDKINSNKISKAQLVAHLDSLKTEFEQYNEIDIYNLPIAEVKEKLQNSEFKLSHIGNVNMRAVETFDKVSEQVNLITEKVTTLEAEEQKIMGIIAEIDKQKIKAFMISLKGVNEIFQRNCSQVSKKGEFSLELENPKDPFNGGLNILIRVSKSKYFDITSLSGGEKTMVSLALIFAIQEFKPYSFYIFDEIDAALDKHNSELLSELIKKYRGSGQYVVITHNDTLISDASTLYGVSMQESISKVISVRNN